MEQVVFSVLCQLAFTDTIPSPEAILGMGILIAAGVWSSVSLFEISCA